MAPYNRLLSHIIFQASPLSVPVSLEMREAVNPAPLYYHNFDITHVQTLCAAKPIGLWSSGNYQFIYLIKVDKTQMLLL